jgi:hypothetical protein
MYKTKGSIIGAILLALVLISGLACSASPAQVPTSPQISTEPEIPNYTTYTDESGLFSISYPADWDVDLLMVPIGQDRQEAINRLQSGLPVEEYSVIFFAGKESPGYQTYVNIEVDPVPATVSTHDQMVDSMLQIARKAYPDLTELSRVNTTVDGKEATILEWEGTISEEQSTFHCLQLYILTDKAIWTVTCGSPPEEADQWRNDFNTIVRSLRIAD